MKGLICYFSTTGNTLLACRYIAQKIKNIDFKLFDITKNTIPDFTSFQVIGFATFAASLGPPVLIENFIKEIPQQKQKYAFLLNTYANYSGKTLNVMKNLLTEKGFTLIAGHALHTPENYPPYIVKGIIHEDAPNYKELERFESFIASLDVLLTSLTNEKTIPETKLRIGWLNSLLPILPRKRSFKKMGEKFVDFDLCTNCGNCKKHCPYQAIELNSKPVFNNEKCYGCWSCYNHCPTQAIYTQKLKGVGHYPKPNKLIQTKLQTTKNLNSY
jgi:ferredoxin